MAALDHPADPDLAYTVASDLLAAASSALDVAPDAPPERQFVSAGVPVADCRGGQLTVHLGPVQVMPSRSQLPTSKVCQFATIARFTITLLRCPVGPGPNGQIPSAADLDAQAERLYRDAWRLWAGLTGLWSAKTLLPHYPVDCEQVAFQQMVPTPPQYDAVGWVWPVDIQLSDVNPTS